MTAALGRPPTVQAGAWVWDDVGVGLGAPLVLPAGALAGCVGQAEGTSGRVQVGLGVARLRPGQGSGTALSGACQTQGPEGKGRS